MTAVVLNAEEEVYLHCSRETNVTKINVERGSEYVVNSRSQKLHVRTFWPDDGEPTAILIYFHGYAAHANRPSQKYMSKECKEKGIAYVCFDFHGHGYSDGLRALVSSLEYLLDDCMCVLKAVYSENGNTEGKTNLDNHANKNIPFFLLGISMGGSTAVAFGHYLSVLKKEIDTDDKDAQSISTLFRGCLLCCPAIDIKVPSPIIVTIMDYFIVPFFGRYSVPEFIQATSSNRHQVWRNEHYVEYIIKDGYPVNPEGLGFCLPIRFQTGSTLLKLAAKCKEIMSDIDFPFLIYHDPQDRVVLLGGSEQLIKLTKTEESKKSLVLVPGGLHDLLTNEMIFITKTSIEWIELQLKNGKNTEKDGSDEYISGMDFDFIKLMENTE